MVIRNYRYTSGGVVNNVEENVQLAMWQMIDGLRVRKDFLQVFELSVCCVGGFQMQRINHFQELPAYQEVLYIPAEHPVNLVVRVIDNGHQEIMSL